MRALRPVHRRPAARPGLPVIVSRGKHSTPTFDAPPPSEIPSQMQTTMNTMMDLLVRLQEVEHCARLALRCKQLTPREKQSARGYVALVREIVPGEVLVLYDRMRRSDSDLLDICEPFAMA